MISKAASKYIRITPRKFRQITPLIKGKRVEYAIAMLASVNKKASHYAIELLESALANAKRLHQGIDSSNLYLSKLIADGGPMLKRYRAASMGRANMIKKRTSHIYVELDEIKKTEKPKEHVNKHDKVKKKKEKVKTTSQKSK